MLVRRRANQRDRLVALDKISNGFEIKRGCEDLPSKFGFGLWLTPIQPRPPKSESCAGIEGLKRAMVDLYSHCLLHGGAGKRQERVDPYRLPLRVQNFAIPPDDF